MPGGITFEHVWAFQIKCMMSNQYDNLVRALEKNDKNLVIAACLRLGWNDAFRHTSKNNDDKTIISNYLKQEWTEFIKPGQTRMNDSMRADVFLEVCKNLVEYFKEYAKCTTTVDRYNYMDSISKDPKFIGIIGVVKDTAAKDKELCIGHVQKMFNIAMKLILCLIESADHARKTSLQVCLQKKHPGTCIYLTDHGLLTYGNFPFAFDTADCPVDSIVLEAIDSIQKGVYTHPPIGSKTYKQIIWSKLGAKEPGENYLLTQNEIRDIQKGSVPAKCNLCFDFENWNK